MVDFSVGQAFAWRLLKPHSDGIIQNVAFPLMCYSKSDEELWNTDPCEYIRLKYGSYASSTTELWHATALWNGTEIWNVTELYPTEQSPLMFHISVGCSKNWLRSIILSPQYLYFLRVICGTRPHCGMGPNFITVPYNIP